MSGAHIMGSGLSFLVGLRSRVENASTYYFRCDPSLSTAERIRSWYVRISGAGTFLFLEIGRSLRPRGTGVSALDKGKSPSRARRRAVFEDIDLLVDRPDGRVDLRS